MSNVLIKGSDHTQVFELISCDGNETVFADLIGVMVLAYIDNLLVDSFSTEDDTVLPIAGFDDQCMILHLKDRTKNYPSGRIRYDVTEVQENEDYPGDQQSIISQVTGALVKSP